MLRTLGTELISSEKVAIIELVKNSYDADASVVLIRFRPPLMLGRGCIEVLDNGHGMGLDELQMSWLDIATPLKYQRTHSESGRRRLLGEKGIGRLAASRLGHDLTLVSRRPNRDEVVLFVDWGQFDQPERYLDEIDLEWHERTPEVYVQGGYAARAFAEAQALETPPVHGTMLQLGRLTRAWNRAEVTDLRSALSRLIRPRPTTATTSPEFAIFLETPEPLEDLTGVVNAPDELLTPHYRLVGTVDRDGYGDFAYFQLDPPREEKLSNVRLWEDRNGNPTAGRFDVELNVWDRDSESLSESRSGLSVRDFRRLLSDVAGVSVYRDGFRVLPFGETGDDWLGLDLRRVQNPTQRVSNNQIIGHIFIGADTNPGLRDQSNREGILDATSYRDLQVLVRAVLSQLEQRRFLARRQPDSPPRPKAGLFDRFDLREVQEAVHARYPADQGLARLVKMKSDEIKFGVEEVQRVISRYSRLATLGSLIDRILHDGRTVVARLKNVVRFGQRDIAKSSIGCEEKVALFGKALLDTGAQAEMLSTLFNQIEPFGGRKRGRPKVVALRSILQHAREVLKSEADEVGITIEISGDDIDVTVDPSELLVVIVNLVQNAIYWVGTVSSGKPGQVAITARRLEDGSVSITVSDTGPGVRSEIQDAVFSPYFSTKPDGVGLGLSIAGSIVQDLYGGELRLIADGPLKGATFEAILRKRV